MIKFAENMEVTVDEQLLQLSQNLSNASNSLLGYPLSRDYDYSSLYDLLKYPINNVGDPFEESTHKIESYKFEREVIDFFAELFRANPKDYWGYVTNGGSESNLYGLYIARELYPNAMVYYSESTHYSVKKNIHLLNIPSIIIRSDENGEIDYQDLENTLRFNRDKPAIILCTFGTTMTEAKDDVSKIKSVLKNLAIQNHYIHCDAALSGAYGSFIEPRPSFDFEDGVDSISISGHKFIGSPIPSGVIITKRSLKDRIAKSISYIGSLDTTISGSRNGHTPLFLWYAVRKMGIIGLKVRYQNSLKLAQYCLSELIKTGIDAWSNPGSITVVLPKVSEPLKSKWQIATSDEWSHVICMPGVSKEQIDHFVSDLRQELDSK